ncbi:sensor histidine kinase [Conexibacter sp. JD483]|uniref:sensor histidine kinase n=1 Tax=unclassified Conexibacter TaxID=2627773 RepID=UPI00271C69E3|nr:MULTISPECIES: sensor histidine kinase [unclassified Conexibacter]MDO8184562.1 sensor histidine kinase [Conexibacter sp. CPCC 205706]MDO8197868.1 sensor histidine kinase [Conexibacter sp. CPCC 205762]MDR9370086.1 sensor histidine kinase [Conexibacter sp. JD483]
MSGAGLTPAKRAANTAIGFVALLGVSWTIVAILTSSRADPRWLSLTLLLTIGIFFTATGMYAWARRPDSWFGLQMSLTGLSWFLVSLAASDDDVIFSLGYAFNSLYAALMAHTLLAFPTGRLQTRAERRVIAVAYAIVLIGPLLLLSVTPTPADLPRNIFLVTPDEGLSDAGQTLLRATLLGVAIVVTGMLVARWQRATSPQRRLLAPVLWCGVATTAALGLSLAGQLAHLPDDVLNVFDFTGLFIFASVPVAFLSGIVRQNLSSGQSVGRLVARLGDGPGRGPNRLRDALASALRDRSLAIAYWLPTSGPARAAGEGRYVDANGAPVALPEPGSGRSFTLVEHDGRRVAALIHDASLDEDPELVRAAGAAAALTLENERLDAELRVQIAEVRASRARLLEVVTRERRRIERDLHDGAQQRLVALALTLGIAENQVEADPEQARALIREARDEARLALEELRELARGIHPAILTDRGLGPALEALASRAPLPVELSTVPQERLPAPIEGAAYFVVAEALANVAKYAGATHAEVSVQRLEGHAIVQVSDDGVGGADPAGGTGLRGLEDRLSAIDGRLAVFSPSGRGTTIRAEIPCSL